jgi:branched-chain amino acid transport system permease protein
VRRLVAGAQKGLTLQTALQLLVTTLQIGAVYVLFSLGLTLIFGIMKVVNFVHGHFFAMSALLVAVLVPKIAAAGMSVQAAYLLGSVAAIAASLVLALVLYQFGIARFLRDMEGAFILTMGMGLFLDGVFLATFGGAVRAVPPVIEGNVSILGAPLTIQRLVLCIVAALVTVIVYWALASTKLGKALRAVAADHEAAMLQGVPYKHIALMGFLLASLLAAFAGVLIAPVSVVTPMMGTDYLMKTFIAIVVGGLGSVPGAIVGALFIGFIEAVGGYYFDSSTATLGVFVLVIVVLLLRPKGLLGHA